MIIIVKKLLETGFSMKCGGKLNKKNENSLQFISINLQVII